MAKGAASTAKEPSPTGGRSLLQQLSLFFFYGYVLSVVAAGVWGIFGARLDFPLLMQQQVGHLDPKGGVNVLSQYRFLRGLELGFGIITLRFRAAVFANRTANQLFLAVMGLGIVGRVMGIVIDGAPSALMLSFLAFEAVGIVVIFVDTRAARKI